MLKQDVLEDIIPDGMEAIDAMHMRQEYREMGIKVFTPRLAGMRKSIKNQVNKAERWGKKNLVRRQLKAHIANGTIPSDMSQEDAWKCCAIYEAIDKDLFFSRLKSMREIVKEAKERAKRDADALVHDRGIHPKQKYDLRGNFNWSEHPARFLLDVDLEDDETKEMMPLQLYFSREEYQDFDLDVFRGHIYQILHTRKWREQWVNGKKEYALV